MKPRQIKKINKYARDLLLTCCDFIEEDFSLVDGIWMCTLQDYYSEKDFPAYYVLRDRMHFNGIKSIKECRQLAKSGVTFR